MADQTQDPLRKQAWDYFQLHAGQRLTTFNFYIVTSGIVTAAMGASFQKDFKFPLVGVFLGILLTYLSFVFWKLDRRNSYLIKNSEAALRVFEDESLDGSGSPSPLTVKLFRLEEQDIDTTKNWFARQYSYSTCFLFVFWAFGIVGLGGAILSIVLFLTTVELPNNCPGSTSDRHCCCQQIK